MVRLLIGIIGDFNPEYLYHQATNQSLDLTAGSLGLEISYEWIATDALQERGARAIDRFDGLWASPGSPYLSMDGALDCIRFARERGKPFVGT
jgi:CTP synthase (UTP-ammonia lyase)